MDNSGANQYYLATGQFPPVLMDSTSQPSIIQTNAPPLQQQASALIGQSLPAAQPDVGHLNNSAFAPIRSNVGPSFQSRPFAPIPRRAVMRPQFYDPTNYGYLVDTQFRAAAPNALWLCPQQPPPKEEAHYPYTVRGIPGISYVPPPSEDVGIPSFAQPVENAYAGGVDTPCSNVGGGYVGTVNNAGSPRMYLPVGQLVSVSPQSNNLAHVIPAAAFPQQQPSLAGIHPSASLISAGQQPDFRIPADPHQQAGVFVATLGDPRIAAQPQLLSRICYEVASSSLSPAGNLRLVVSNVESVPRDAPSAALAFTSSTMFADGKLTCLVCWRHFSNDQELHSHVVAQHVKFDSLLVGDRAYEQGIRFACAELMAACKHASAKKGLAEVTTMLQRLRDDVKIKMASNATSRVVMLSLSPAQASTKQEAVPGSQQRAAPTQYFEDKQSCQAVLAKAELKSEGQHAAVVSTSSVAVQVGCGSDTSASETQPQLAKSTAKNVKKNRHCRTDLILLLGSLPRNARFSSLKSQRRTKTALAAASGVWRGNTSAYSPRKPGIAQKSRKGRNTSATSALSRQGRKSGPSAAQKKTAIGRSCPLGRRTTRSNLRDESSVAAQDEFEVGRNDGGSEDEAEAREATDCLSICQDALEMKENDGEKELNSNACCSADQNGRITRSKRVDTVLAPLPSSKAGDEIELPTKRSRLSEKESEGLNGRAVAECLASTSRKDGVIPSVKCERQKATRFSPVALKMPKLSSVKEPNHAADSHVKHMEEEMPLTGDDHKNVPVIDLCVSDSEDDEFNVGWQSLETTSDPSKETSSFDGSGTSTSSKFKPLSLVWVRIYETLWHAGIVIDPHMPKAGIWKNGQFVNSPPPLLLKKHLAKKSENAYLIHTFCQRRTWLTAKEDSLEPLGVDEAADKLKANLPASEIDRRLVSAGYYEAKKYRCFLEDDLPDIHVGPSALKAEAVENGEEKKESAAKFSEANDANCSANNGNSCIPGASDLPRKSSIKRTKTHGKKRKLTSDANSGKTKPASPLEQLKISPKDVVEGRSTSTAEPDQTATATDAVNGGAAKKFRSPKVTTSAKSASKKPESSGSFSREATISPPPSDTDLIKRKSNATVNLPSTSKSFVRGATSSLAHAVGLERQSTSGASRVRTLSDELASAAAIHSDRTKVLEHVTEKLRRSREEVATADVAATDSHESAAVADSDDDVLFLKEVAASSKKEADKKPEDNEEYVCQFAPEGRPPCGRRVMRNLFKVHTYKHLKDDPWECPYCRFGSRIAKRKVLEHIEEQHKGGEKRCSDRREDYAEEIAQLLKLCFEPEVKAPAKDIPITKEIKVEPADAPTCSNPKEGGSATGTTTKYQGKCFLCGRQVGENRRMMKQHIWTDHSEKREHLCGKCEFSAMTPKEIERHHTTTHPQMTLWIYQGNLEVFNKTFEKAYGESVYTR